MKVEIISASAGTGKTHRLCQEVVEALTTPGERHARIEGLVAITYTRKAEAELRRRIRRELIRRGLIREAQRLPLAYCGTVHAVCLRLLTEHALFVGLPPALDVVPEDAADRELARALEKALAPADRARFDDVCSRMQPNADSRKDEYNWIVDAQDLIELARSNCISAKQLPEMARRSADSLLALLPASFADGDALDAQLADALVAAIAAIDRQQDTTATTTKAVKLLHDARRRLEAGSLLTWSNWLQLSKLEPAVGARPLVASVRQVAEDHLRHPRFHADLRDYITLLYELVARGLDDYTRWKHSRRLIDYVDMEESALRLLERRDVADRLREELDLIVIDEFQDTSPIQLELFVRLQALAKRSVWVGDRKQSIFAFRGADPMLMDSVIDAVKESGRQIEVLGTNYRSRPTLVDFVSRAFSPAFVHKRIPSQHVATNAHRSEDPLSALPPIGCWWLNDSNQDLEAAAIARGVMKLLAYPERTIVIDPETNTPRPLRAGDIAILSATNKETQRIAGALEARGISTVVARGGLLRTPEGTALVAALRLIVDRSDYAAVAELDALDGFDGRGPDEWLSERIRAYAQERGRPQSRGLVRRVEEVRQSVVPLSPSEAVDRLVSALDLGSLCRRWPRPTQGVANLDALAALAQRYEENCSRSREAASLAGFLMFLSTCSGDGSDAQQPVADNAVQICTYHRSKGLEWPVVILTSLDSKSRAYGVTPDAAAARLERGQQHRVFGAAPESDATRFDARAPLAGRWLRMWPWPYPGHRNAALGAKAAETDEAERVRAREVGESLRLLYVGFTRARDHLVLSAQLDKKTGQPKAEWLNAINDGRVPLIQAPVGERELQQLTIAGCDHAFDARVWRIEAADQDERLRGSAEHRREFSRSNEANISALPFRITPSRAGAQWAGLPTVRIAKSYSIGGRAAFDVSASDQAEAGSAVHEFLAADRSTRASDERIALAATILETHAIAGLHAADMVAAADALRNHLEQRWPGAEWHYEVPISAMLGGSQGRRRIEGRIDLLLETKAGWVIVDHKTYPGGKREWETHATSDAPQLAAYRQVLLMSNTMPVETCLVHFPIAGGLVELAFE